MNEVISDLLALSVPCPLCGAPVDYPCVYVWPKGVSECYFPYGYDTCVQHKESQHVRLAKVGTPTRTTHNARKQLVFTRRVRQRQLQEIARLRNWLINYGSIFKEDGSG